MATIKTVLSDQKSISTKSNKEKFRFPRLFGFGKQTSRPTSTIVVTNKTNENISNNKSTITAAESAADPSHHSENNSVKLGSVKSAIGSVKQQTTTTTNSDSLECKKSTYNWLTKTKSFHKLVNWSFSVCDTKKEGKIGKSELYSGILLVHLSLSKYVGPAACYPPTVDVCNKLFDAADDDNSGFVDLDEFEQIVIVCFGQITSRIIAYYALIILAVPYVANLIVTGLRELDNLYDIGMQEKHMQYPILVKLDEIITFGSLAQKIVSAILFAVAIPKLFDWIDSMSEGVAANIEVIRTVPPVATTTTSATTAPSSPTKKTK